MDTQSFKLLNLPIRLSFITQFMATSI